VHVPLSKNVIKAKAEAEVAIIDLHFRHLMKRASKMLFRESRTRTLHSSFSIQNYQKHTTHQKCHLVSKFTPAQTKLTRAACCKLPPVEAEYSPKGSYEKINGYKTYVTGPEDSDKAIVAIYDIFGFSPQILQGVSSLLIMDQQLISGADLLSSTGARVYMPDFLKGEYATAEMFSGSEE